MAIFILHKWDFGTYVRMTYVLWTKSMIWPWMKRGCIMTKQSYTIHTTCCIAGNVRIWKFSNTLICDSFLLKTLKCELYFRKVMGFFWNFRKLILAIWQYSTRDLLGGKAHNSLNHRFIYTIIRHTISWIGYCCCSYNCCPLCIYVFCR